MRVGLIFTDQGIKLVKIAGSKTLLLKIPLEKGMLEDGVIKDTEKLQAVLKKNSRELNLSKSEVILGISEKHIFSKATTISDGVLDLDEKINEEVNSSVPGGAASYSDWQVVEKSQDHKTVFIASVGADLLDSYLEMLKNASIRVIGIEPLAFALSRHVPKALPKENTNPPSHKTKEQQKDQEVPEVPQSKESCLAIDLEEDEVLLTITNEKGRIALTSVLPHELLGHASELLSEISDMRSFYDKKNQEKKIGRALITGEGATDALKNQIATNLGIAVDFLRIPNDALSVQDSLSFFPVFALADLPITFPKNHECINLLSEEMLRVEEQTQKTVYREKLMKLAASVFAVLSVLYVFLFGFLVWSQYMFDKEAEAAREKELVVSGDSSKLRDTIASVNKYVAIVKKVKAREDNVLEVLSFLEEKTPGGIVIHRYMLDLPKHTVSLTGQSIEREVLLGFKQVLVDEGKFQKVSIPLASLEKKGATNFSLSFEVKQ